MGSRLFARKQGIAALKFQFNHRSHARNGQPPRAAALGPLETRVMTILCARGECSVRDVTARVGRSLAYTTVMTTLDRLFKKGLLDRRKSERAFLYSPRVSRSEWERQVTDDLVTAFLASSARSRDHLLSFFVDAAGRYDEEFLDDLENRIRMKRQQRCRRGQS